MHTLSSELKGDFFSPPPFKKGIIFQKASIYLVMPCKFKAVVKDAGSGFGVLPIRLSFPGFTLSSCLFCD